MPLENFKVIYVRSQNDKNQVRTAVKSVIWNIYWPLPLRYYDRKKYYKPTRFYYWC